jgi:tetratricopeptide (TPR) repeat protein
VSPCPSAETLDQLGTDSTDNVRFHEVEQHVEQCADCQRALDHLAHGEISDDEARSGAVPDGDVPPEIPGFVIDAELGRGGMGVVYRAWQPLLCRRVALKVVPSGPNTGPRSREHWLREARSVAHVRNPRIVQLHDVGESNGWLYLVLEHVPGGSLKDRLRGPLPPRDAAILAEQIAGAVESMHQAGVRHLDLKPSNILLDSEPNAPWEAASPKVADFGIARLADDAATIPTTHGGPWGTPSYMAPEQVDGRRAAVGPAADIYALGAVLYELLTGRPPFQAASVLDTLSQVREQEPAAPRRLNPSVPRDLETICLTCLRKDPRRRYGSAEALAEDLRRWRDGLPIKARPVGGLQRAWRLARRWPLTAGLIAALLLTLTGGLIVALALWRRSEAERKSAEQSRDIAQANYVIASQSMRELADFAARTASDPSIARAVPPYFENVLRTARSQQIELIRRNALQPGATAQLAGMDYLLASIYSARGRTHEARPLFEESIDRWETIINQDGESPQIRACQLSALIYLGRIGNRLRESPQWWDQKSLPIYHCLCRYPRYVENVIELARQERKLADSLAMRGETECALRFLERRLDLFDSLLQVNPESFELIVSRSLTLAALGKDAGRPLTDWLSSRRGTISEGPRRAMLISCLAELTARSFGLRFLGAPTSRAELALSPPEVWSEQVVNFIKEGCAALQLDPKASLEVSAELRDLVIAVGAEQRSLGKLGDARQTAERLVTIAAAFSRAYPDQAEPYLVLSQGHLQHAKNAWKLENRALVERNLRRSLEAAKRAVLLDPSSDDAHHFVVDRQRRLAQLGADDKPKAIGSAN